MSFKDFDKLYKKPSAITAEFARVTGVHLYNIDTLRDLLIGYARNLIV